VKMRNGERICNLSIMVVQSNSRVVEVAWYETETEQLHVDYDALDNIVWPGANPHWMPVRNTGKPASTYCR